MRLTRRIEAAERRFGGNGNLEIVRFTTVYEDTSGEEASSHSYAVVMQGGAFNLTHQGPDESEAEFVARLQDSARRSRENQRAAK